MTRQTSDLVSPVYTPFEVTMLMNAGREKPIISESKIREIIRKEIEAGTPDEHRFIPGARVDQNVMLIYRGIFEQVTSGRAISRVAPVTMIDPLRRVERETA